MDWKPVNWRKNRRDWRGRDKTNYNVLYRLKTPEMNLDDAGQERVAVVPATADEVSARMSETDGWTAAGVAEKA